MLSCRRLIWSSVAAVLSCHRAGPSVTHGHHQNFSPLRAASASAAMRPAVGVFPPRSNTTASLMPRPWRAPAISWPTRAWRAFVPSTARTSASDRRGRCRHAWCRLASVHQLHVDVPRGAVDHQAGRSAVLTTSLRSRGGDANWDARRAAETVFADRLRAVGGRCSAPWFTYLSSDLCGGSARPRTARPCPCRGPGRRADVRRDLADLLLVDPRPRIPWASPPRR